MQYNYCAVQMFLLEEAALCIHWETNRYCFALYNTKQPHHAAAWWAGRLRVMSFGGMLRVVYLCSKNFPVVLAASWFLHLTIPKEECKAREIGYTNKPWWRIKQTPSISSFKNVYKPVTKSETTFLLVISVSTARSLAAETTSLWRIQEK